MNGSSLCITAGDLTRVGPHHRYITGLGYTTVGRVIHEGADLTEGPVKVENLVVLSGSLASNAELRECDGTWQIEGDPTEAAFLVARTQAGGWLKQESLSIPAPTSPRSTPMNR
ncbi:MAG TPA: hypothetical protein VF086_09450 [Propionibacteriaceae bacterium]